MTTSLIPNTSSLRAEHIKVSHARIRHGNFHMLYRTLIKRIAFGYSPKEVSFLLGYPENYISNIESLNRDPGFLFNQLISLAYIYHCSIDNFLPLRPFSQDRINIQLKQIITGKSTMYEASEEKNGELILLFKLTDFHYTFPMASTATINVENQLYDMFYSGFFDQPKDALEILYQICNKTGEHVKPCYIESWITSLMNRKGANKLKRGKDKGIFIYGKKK